MGLYDLMFKVGGKLGLIKLITAPDEPATKKITTRTVTLQELASEIRKTDVQALAELPAELSVPFDKVFEAAGIKPSAHGWSVDRVAQLLQTDPYKSLGRPEVQKGVLTLMSADKAQVQDLVK